MNNFALDIGFVVTKCPKCDGVAIPFDCLGTIHSSLILWPLSPSKTRACEAICTALNQQCGSNERIGAGKWTAFSEYEIVATCLVDRINFESAARKFRGGILSAPRIRSPSVSLS
jgi:hypothetical protein